MLSWLAGAAPAAAHAQFLGSDPAEGSRLPELPTTVVLTHSLQIAPEFIDTAVITPDGSTLTTTATTSGVEVTVDLTGETVRARATEPGTWQLVNRVVSVGGYPVEHMTGFTVTEPAEATVPSGPPNPGAGDELPSPGTADPSRPPSRATESAPTGNDATAAGDQREPRPGWSTLLLVTALLLAVAVQPSCSCYDAGRGGLRGHDRCRSDDRNNVQGVDRHGAALDDGGRSDRACVRCCRTVRLPGASRLVRGRGHH